MSKNIQYLAWDSIDWTLVQKRVHRVQIRIYKAKQSNEISKMYWLQKLVLASTDAKLLAIQKVISIHKVSGVYNRINLTNIQKIQLAKKLRIDGKAHPIKKVWISNSSKVQNKPLEISIIKDQAKQILVKLALDPEWAAVFESNSYEYRSTRKVHEAIESIFCSLNNKNLKWIFSADIRESFHDLKFQILLEKLNTFPLLEKQIKSWLNAGILQAYANTNKDIIFQIFETQNGGIISPLLINIAIHDLENHLNSFVDNLKYRKLQFVRFSHHFVLIHEKQEVLNFCILEINKWLSDMGFDLILEKSSLKPGTLGFDFLGFQIIQVSKHNKYKAKITPSKTSQKLLLLKIRNIIQKNKAISAYHLIRKLRPLILEWGNYFKFCECTTIYRNLSHRIFLKLRAWVFSKRYTLSSKYN